MKGYILYFGWKFFLSLLCVFVVALSFRIYYLNQKVDMHLDEVLSIILSEYNEYGWGRGFEDNPNVDSKLDSNSGVKSSSLWSSEELKRAVLWNDSSLSGALKDSARLWNTNRDSPHTNLYYTLLRLWHIGFESSDLSSIYARAISLNIVFFTLSFVVAFLVIVKLFTPFLCPKNSLLDSNIRNGGGGGESRF